MKKRHPQPDETPEDDEREAIAPEAAGDAPEDDFASQQDLGQRVAEAAALAAQVAALEDKIKRVQADFLNDTKRIRAQADSEGQYAIQRVVVDLLPVLDALHGAAATVVESTDAKALREGMDLVVRQLDEVLTRHGVSRIEAAGRPFDPSVHEALMLVERDDLPPQTVVEVVRPGFTLNGRVVRPAHVTVSRTPADNSAEPPPEGRSSKKGS